MIEVIAWPKVYAQCEAAIVAREPVFVSGRLELGEGFRGAAAGADDTEGAAAGSTPDQALMRNEYYQIRGLDDKGVPTPELLDAMALGWLKEKLYR